MLEPGKEDVVHDCETPGDSIMTSFLYTLEIPEKVLEDVVVVKDFPDVFKEVQGLPPRRVVEFRIDLVQLRRTSLRCEFQILKHQGAQRVLMAPCITHWPHGEHRRDGDVFRGHIRLELGLVSMV